MPVNHNITEHSEMDAPEIHAEELAYQAREVLLLLEKPAVKAAFGATENRFIEEWKRAESTPAREFCWAKIKALKDFQSTLRGWAERTGKT